MNQTEKPPTEATFVPNFTEIVRYRLQAPRLKTIKVVHDLIGRHGPISPFLRDQAKRTRKGKPLRVLDIGAYDRALGHSLAACNLAGAYHSVDLDLSHPHEFHDIGEVTEKYDLICVFELIEHLSLEAVAELFHRVIGLLLPGGKLLVSTPNPFYPTRFFADMTHRQHWPAHDLFALLRHVGFDQHDIEMYGIVFRERFSVSSAPKLCVDWLRNAVWRVIGLEIRGGILAIATKTDSHSSGLPVNGRRGLSGCTQAGA